MIIRNLSRNDGIALLTIVIMLSGLIGLVAVCAFIMGNEADDDARYDETRERMLEVKRALIGRLVDIGGGEDITSCGGFISDYGEPDDPTAFRIDDLLNNSGFTPWDYDSTHLFWVGYRDDRYLEANAKKDNQDTFIDGWGYPIEVFISDSGNGDTIVIKSLGSDLSDDGSNTYTDYRRDVIDAFYWRRSVSVRVCNGKASSCMSIRLVYPYRDEIQDISFYDSPVAQNTTGTFDVTKKIPIGLRKILVWDDDISSDTKIITYCIPQGKDTDIVEIRYEG